MILFDLDDTLVIEEQAAVDAFLAVGESARQQCGLDPETLHQTIRQCARRYWHESPARPWCLAVGISSWEGLWADFQGDQPELQALQAWSHEYRRAAWSTALRECGADDSDLADELALRFIQERDRRHKTFPDVLPVLRSLSTDNRMAVLTNGFSHHQWRKLRGAGLEGFFETVIVSGDHGIGKPDPRIFSIAMSALGLSAAEVCMVGDSLSSDIAGARTSGLRAIWVNRDNVTPNDDAVPDAIISDLWQLPGLVR
ncbi:MAG TPA: HAD family hydrolase [Armatimonadota bacterium]|nr:HAD family hydrolase [Armatimonadota bacterium]